jgi:hypothetical protein
MENKQTAVEWLEIQLKKGVDINPLDLVSYTKAVDKLFEEAKSMEKEQIVTAHLTPLRNEYWYKDKEWLNNESEDYYNETYNK